MVKQQHFVPQCYLKNFANSHGQIWVYDKSADKVFLSKTDGVACEKFFYDSEKLDKVVGQEQFIEKALSLLEGQASAVFQNLLGRLNGNQFVRMHRNERYFLAQFIAVQMLRTREHRIKIEQISNQLSAWMHSSLTEEMKANASPGQIPPLKISESQLAEMQGMFLSDPKVILKYAEMLDSHFWIILRAVPEHTFLTSDHPIVKKPNVHRPFHSMSGLASKGIEIGFPLSPNYYVCLYERTYFEDKLQRIKSLEDGLYALKDRANMDYHNHLQVMQSNRFLFDVSKEFSFARAVCDEQPQWRNQFRRRVASNTDPE